MTSPPPPGIILVASLPPGMIAYVGPDGAPLCAACGCPAELHCGVCGCRSGAGTPDECLCAKLVTAIPTCPHCGLRFSERWRLQNHLMPNPTCRGAARQAAGKFAQPPTFEPPIRAGVH
jgi:hypothetical protein